MNPVQRLLVVTVARDEVDLASDRLWRLGVRGVVESDRSDGLVDLTTSVGEDRTAIDRATAQLDPAWTWRLDTADTDPASAANGWRRTATPTWCRDDIVVAPAWRVDDLDVDAGTTVIAIEPGASFGLGDHPTTRSCVRVLADELDSMNATRQSTLTVLDVGCGSGVLSILAALRGVAPVRAVDVAHAAVSATRDNARRNGVGSAVVVDTTPLAELDPLGDGRGADLVLANILAPELIALAPHLRRHLAPGGRLVISGVLAEGNGHGHRHVLDALAPLTVVSTTTDDGWATVTLAHPT